MFTFRCFFRCYLLSGNSEDNLLFRMIVDDLCHSFSTCFTTSANYARVMTLFLLLHSSTYLVFSLLLLILPPLLLLFDA